jgi:lipopolysaccharide export system permease protein
MFILIMQFFWLYIDDLMGKGIEVYIILELLLFVSASLIPLALPLAILLSSIMTFGNLSENNELTALKSSGLSLLRIMRPLIFVVLIIASCTFYFANYVIPVANLKWHSIIYDIQNTKIAAILSPGAYTKELDGYAIKVDKVNNDKFTNIIIHDHSKSSEIKTIRAEAGRMYKSVNGKYLFFELNKGNVVEELSAQAPLFDENENIINNQNSNRPARRTTFDKSTYKIDLTGFALNRSEEELFKNDFEMLNVFQLKYAIDSIQTRSDSITSNFVKSIKSDHMFFQSQNIKLGETRDSSESRALPARTIFWDSLNGEDKSRAIGMSQTALRRKIDNLTQQKAYMEMMVKSMRDYEIESQRKIALTYTIIVLFFIGAPLGAIVRKGGFGAPVVIAALLFMFYFILFSLGENFAKQGLVSPFLGMWFPSMILTPLAIILMRAAVNDSPLFVMDNWVKFFLKFKKKANENLARN